MHPLIPSLGVAALASPMEVGAGRAAQAAEELGRLLAQGGCRVVGLGVIDAPDAAAAAGRKLAEAHVDAVALAAASWFEDYLALDLLEECPVPVLFWSLPGMETGALCGVQQATACLKQLERPFQAVFDPMAKGAGLDRGLVFLRAAALARRLRRARIGLAGQRVPGMSESAASEWALKKAVGPRVVPVDMVKLLEASRAEGDPEAAALWSRVKVSVGTVKVSDEAGRLAAGMTLAIREVVWREGLSGLAFGCYPDFMGWGCLAASLLADEGIPIGCEGDVNGVVGMLMLALLTGRPTHNTDWLEPLADGSVVFSHCGSGSYTLAERPRDIALAPVRLANQGVCSLFPAKPGPVTLVNLVPAGAGYQLAVLEGEALSADMVFPGNPLRVKFQAPVREVMDWIHAEGVGHHWMAGYGQVAAELDDWAALAAGQGLRLTALSPRKRQCLIRQVLL